ncbi:aldolase catalytic domain-containing protein [Butyrivibrio sp. YAB3001]|uniref:aldolase catalytic domain-containing protein n=1 Tax=Butyrivibrio sp. YAB3001 TaxID=1520812 RepID=UPI0008F637E9|nr:aldolase catalytic domain-containing protein [Butyrivibrio sp. YAB3001]SFC22998.1 4-hydroxy 2-oxovalerate aldolase [Butyrivibrio sp. YAB3001]
MAQYDLKILDCTLRDGGYVNDWNWGYHDARAIIRFLSKAKVDFVEVGFLRNVPEYNQDITVCNTIEELNRLLPDNETGTMYSAMAMRSNYDISKLSDYCGSGIEMIRITAHDYDIEEGMDFAKQVKEKGYKLSINPINIMGYSDKKILWIIEQVNMIQPYQFSIVDTFGSMKRRDLDRIVSLVDNNLDRNIRVALHLHENMSLGCSLAQCFVDKHLNRPVAIDGSLMGMGRIPGNLPIELIADYLNEYLDTGYDIDYLMDAIQEYIAPIKGLSKWGYTPAYFLSARFNVHRNYAEHYLEKGDLTNRDINHILGAFDRSKATAYDEAYAEARYKEYKDNLIDDHESYTRLKQALDGKKVLIMAPGTSIVENRTDIDDFIAENDAVVISINFIPEDYNADYAFFSNAKRFAQASDSDVTLILTSNVETEKDAIRFNYNSLSSAFEKGYNSYVMLLKLLSLLGMDRVYVAGADGFITGKNNYYKSSLKSSTPKNEDDNIAVARAIHKIGIDVEYITESAYAIN